ncbi:ER degradation-enhancing alpha-mannosidase-like protein 3 isoform X2 [Mya arenaria]|uniref:ER degradation-enhancing alpha-mannosidase-like protein 3 isoform X2 n=1 Tax=Mya arenaria TaxID=6604 RepID=UPI0022E6BF96|nr:ER degradation-enhancing alpha-mannosidase-like protein 3 isoform X2 [Mya arenaria]
MSSNTLLILLITTFVVLMFLTDSGQAMDSATKQTLKNKVVEMFKHAFGAYMNHAFPADELMPLSCKGRYRGSEPSRGDIDDSLGNFSLTLIDSLDTIAIMGDVPEFDKAVKLVVNSARFDTDVVVSVFETNIRVLGGLLGGHVLATYFRKRKLGMDWYRDELLNMAKDIGTRLLPAFNTSTGIPYPRINLKYGIGKDIAQNCKDTCTACAGTMILEFAALSRLTGDPVFEDKAHKAMDYLWNQRHRSSDLVGTVINIHNGDWIRRESGVGAGIDSYYEYVLKAYILLGDDTYLTRFNKHYDAVKKYISQGPRFIDVHMHRPMSASRNFMDALLAFWPGLQVLKGDIQPAIEVHEMLYQVIQRHNFLPEAFTSDFHIHWGHHPLRPEFVESTYFLYKATGDSHYLDVGQKVIENLDELARVPCGFAAIKDVTKGTHEDQMDSFVLAETFKYLYLLYAEKSELIIDVDDYIFTTEAHLLPLSLSRCNSSKPAELRLSRELYSNLQRLDDEAREEDEFGDSNHNTCPNPQIRYTLDYAHNLRAGLKDLVDKSSTVSSPQQCSNVPLKAMSRFRATDFVAGNQDQLEQLQDMGIKLLTMADGRIQLLHTASDALSPAHAEQGLLFMQEMIELAKNQPKESVQSEPMFIKIMSSPHDNMVYRAGPAQFGYDLNTRPGVRGKLAVGKPIKMCSSSIDNTAELKGKIVIIERGNCMFIDKARQLQSAGALGGIVMDQTEGTSVNSQPLFAMSGDGKDDVYIPVVFVYNNEGQHLLRILQSDPDVEIIMAAKLEAAGPEIPDLPAKFPPKTADQFTINMKAHDQKSSQSDEKETPTSKTFHSQMNLGPLKEYNIGVDSLKMAVRIDADESVKETDDSDDVIKIETNEEGVNEIYFRFDKLRAGTDGSPILEDIYEELRTTLFKKTNFRLLENQSAYLNAIVRLLQSAYFGNGKIDERTSVLFKDLANELELVDIVEDELEESDIDDSSLPKDEIQSDKVSDAFNDQLLKVKLENKKTFTVQYKFDEMDETVKVINNPGIGVKVTRRVVKPVSEHNLPNSDMGKESYATEEDFEPVSASNNKLDTGKFSQIKNSASLEEEKDSSTQSIDTATESIQGVNTESSNDLGKNTVVKEGSGRREETVVGINTDTVNSNKEFNGDINDLERSVNPELAVGLKQVLDKTDEKVDPHSREFQEKKYGLRKDKPVFEKTVKNLRQSEHKTHHPHDEH